MGVAGGPGPWVAVGGWFLTLMSIATLFGPDSRAFSHGQYWCVVGCRQLNFVTLAPIPGGMMNHQRLYVCMYVCMYARVNVCMYVCMYVCMLDYIALYCIELRCIVLHYCIVLHCIVLYCIASHCAAPHCIVSYSIVLYCIDEWMDEWMNGYTYGRSLGNPQTILSDRSGGELPVWVADAAARRTNVCKKRGMLRKMDFPIIVRFRFWQFVYLILYIGLDL